MQLPDGYSDVPAGKVAAAVTCLEMRARPPVRAAPSEAGWSIRRVVEPSLPWYRDLYARVGLPWLWFSRLQATDEALAATLGDPAVEVYALAAGGRDEGLLELDFREPQACELAFFGLTGALLGRGAGRSLMNRALEAAWARPIDRLWVHTCTLDHPSALGFYLRSGFRPYARRVEVFDDPRLVGLAPRSAAPHVPIIEAEPAGAAPEAPATGGTTPSTR